MEGKGQTAGKLVREGGTDEEAAKREDSAGAGGKQEVPKCNRVTEGQERDHRPVATAAGGCAKERGGDGATGAGEGGA